MNRRRGAWLLTALVLLVIAGFGFTQAHTSGHGRSASPPTNNADGTHTPASQSVTAYAGDNGGATVNQGCSSDPSCSYIGATLSGFSGVVTCSVKSATWPGGIGGFVTWSASNGSKVGPDYAGWRGKGYTVRLSCGGVDSPPLKW